ncbi:MAG: hypothetical protein ABSC11_15555, partial [Smithella sp.]
MPASVAPALLHARKLTFERRPKAVVTMGARVSAPRYTPADPFNAPSAKTLRRKIGSAACRDAENCGAQNCRIV